MGHSSRIVCGLSHKKVTVSGLRGRSIPWPLVLQPHHHISYFVQMVIGGAKLDMNHWLHLKENNEDH